MAENKKYTPINCDNYDIITEKIIRARPVLLEYRTEEGAITSMETRLADVYTKAGEEFLKLASGTVIRLDHINAIDGQKI